MYSQRMADVIKVCRKIANGMIGIGLIIPTLACLLTPSLASAQRGELTAFGWLAVWRSPWSTAGGTSPAGEREFWRNAKPRC